MAHCIALPSLDGAELTPDLPAILQTSHSQSVGRGPLVGPKATAGGPSEVIRK